VPKYDYFCDDCQKATEITQKITEDEIKNCPKCNSEKFRKIITTAPSFTLNGSGWFKSGGY